MADPMAASRLLEQQPAAEHGIGSDFNGASGRSSWPRPASSSNCRASSTQRSSTSIRRGRMPSEPSSTLMFWSSTRWGILAPVSNASTAETSTGSLARTSSRHTMSSSDVSGGSPNAPSPSDFAPVHVIARRPVLQIGDQLHFPPPAGHRVEHQTCDDREERQQHEPGRQDRGRKPRHDALLEIGHEDRNREHDRKAPPERCPEREKNVSGRSER